MYMSRKYDPICYPLPYILAAAGEGIFIAEVYIQYMAPGGLHTLYVSPGRFVRGIILVMVHLVIWRGLYLE